VEREEGRILRDGEPLSSHEARDAQSAGVRRPEKVRLLAVDIIPGPHHPALRLANRLAALVSPTAAGITFGRGIYVRQDFWRRRDLIAHELVHVAQYERLGGVRNFLAQYLEECVRLGYLNSPLEQEAIRRGREICERA